MNVDVATLADLPGIMALEASFDKKWSEQSWRDEITGTGRLVLIARTTPRGQAQEPEIIGVACFQHVDEVVDLHRIVVAPEHRRLGFARVMLVAGLQWAIERGARRMLLEVDHRNEPAITLYRLPRDHPPRRLLRPRRARTDPGTRPRGRRRRFRRHVGHGGRR